MIYMNSKEDTYYTFNIPNYMIIGFIGVIFVTTLVLLR